jgi:DNA-binding NtrC family response regulator
MGKKDLLEGKKILIVDDEPDVLESLEETLTMCDVRSANSFDAAMAYLEAEAFDIAILDIMGVNGYELLQIANTKGVIPVMLTAHALTPEDAAKSFKAGAASYLPKEKMTDIKTFLNDILEAKEKGKSFWWRWFERLGDYYDKKFGPDWKEADKDIWEMIKYGA